MPLSSQQIADCLSVYPFEGDFGMPGDKILSDKIVVARKDHRCHICPDAIRPGQHNRVLTAIFEGALQSYRFCEGCCVAFAVSQHDDGRAWEARYRLRRKGRRA